MRISDWSSDVCSSDLAFLEKWIPAGKSPMCGNSICQDRRFLARWMPSLEHYFHYRNLDVSTLKELCTRWTPEIARGYSKHSRHLALDDIKDSIEELRYYRNHFLRRSEEHTSELQSLMRISYAVFCLKKKKSNHQLQ